jgi:threonine dehydrogenase-like Zn-dependent dehydrogenase
MSQGKVRIEPIISHRVPLEEVERGIAMLRSHEAGVWKIVLTYPE